MTSGIGTDCRPLLRAMFDAAVAAAQPALCLPAHLPPRPKGRTVVIGAGKASVTLKGDGRGGRNVEFLLSLAIALDGKPGVHTIAGDTDGVDGVEEIAGAFRRFSSTTSIETANHFCACLRAKC